MFEFIFNNLLWTQGFYIFAGTFIVGYLGYYFWKPLLYLSFLFFLFCLFFFRSPMRHCAPRDCDASALICPADGRVVEVGPSPIANDYFTQRVAIYLSPFDVHVQWTPMSGVVEKITYSSGAFAMAFLPKASELNERADIIIQATDGRRVKVRQIAGTIARRICWWITEDERVDAGYKYGMIRFGSRVEVFLPANVAIDVVKGQRVWGGQTVLGRWN